MVKNLNSYIILENRRMEQPTEVNWTTFDNVRELYSIASAGEFCIRPFVKSRIFEVSITVLLYHFIAIVLHGYRTVHNTHHVLSDKYS